MAGIPLSVQLYTLRDACGTDMAGTLKKVARIGYKNVELAGFGNLGVKDLQKALKDNGLKVSSAHVAIEQIEQNLDQVLADYALLGTKNIVVSYLNEDRRKDAACWKQVGKSLDKAGKICKKRGFTLSHHNHDFEFKWYGGKTGWDILLENTEPGHLYAELDCFWTRFAGFCPACYIEKLGDRLLLVHLKDMAPESTPRFANVGDGILDIPAIVAAGKKRHVKAYVVERDHCYGEDPFKAIKTSYNNLKKMGFVG